MKVCKQCGIEKSDTEYSERYSICKPCYALNTKAKRGSYNADNIKILKPEEIQEQFGNWASTAHQLAHDYKKPIEFIERGLEACRRSHVSEDYFVERYLNANKSIAQNRLVADAYVELMKEQGIYGAFTA
jgi:hypothetical protein